MTTEAEYQETIAVLRRALMESRAPALSAWRAMRDCPTAERVLVTSRFAGERAVVVTIVPERERRFYVAWQPLPTPFTSDPADLEVSDG